MSETDDIPIPVKKRAGNPNWVKGCGSANGRGKPKGTISFKAILIRKLQTCASAKEKKSKASLICDKLLRAAMDGEDWAIREVMDRVDGRAKQTTAHEGQLTVKQVILHDDLNPPTPNDPGD